MDKREVFTIVEDDLTGEGVKLPARQEGDSPSLKNGVIGFSFKDSAGNLVLPQLDSSGRLPTTPIAGACKYGYAKATPAGLGSDTALGEVTGALAKKYNEFEVSLSCMFPTSWELVYIDDAAGTPVETVLWSRVTGPGDYGVEVQFECIEVDTTGGTGVQKFQVRGAQLTGAVSDMRGYIGVREV